MLIGSLGRSQRTKVLVPYRGALPARLLSASPGKSRHPDPREFPRFRPEAEAWLAGPDGPDRDVGQLVAEVLDADEYRSSVAPSADARLPSLNNRHRVARTAPAGGRLVLAADGRRENGCRTRSTRFSSTTWTRTMGA